MVRKGSGVRVPHWACLWCLGTWVSYVSGHGSRFWGAWPAAGLSVLVAPVGLVGVDLVGGEDFAGGEVGDGDVVLVGEREDAFAGVGGEPGKDGVGSGCPPSREMPGRRGSRGS